MNRKNQKALDAQAAARQAERNHDALAEIAQTTGQTEATPEITPEAQATIAQIEAIEAAKQTLRDFGLYYEIQSDRTIDREACLCGCGQYPAGKKSVYLPGHDAKHHAALKGTTRTTSRECACGCGGTTKGGTWLPGHDAKYASAQKKLAKEQPLVNLIEMCEQVA